MQQMRLWSAKGELKSVRRTGPEVRELLLAARKLPEVHLYPRSDGPGSSQDLSQFAAMGHRLPATRVDFSDPAWVWSRGCLRTPGACIDGEPIIFRARPSEGPLATEYYAPDFHAAPLKQRQLVVGRSEFFVNNILHQFGLEGVRIDADPMPAIYRGTGLGGSNLAHLAAMILGSALAGVDLSQGQIYVSATQLENQFGVHVNDRAEVSYGVSLTGGQEALATLQGGFYDNVHLPWFNGPFSVVSRPLLSVVDYAAARQHLLLVNVGRRRAPGVSSSAINNIWMAGWRDPEGAARHAEKPLLAYRAAEALRLQDWALYAELVGDYRRLRAHMCPDYLAGQDELAQLCHDVHAEFFPLGAGTGTCLVVAAQADSISEVADHFAASVDAHSGRMALPFAIRDKGVEFFGFSENGLQLPAEAELL
ncbi:MAG: hypothetical protein L3J63_11500 [Geopsychrobacter sp.]|nr:hypothetical protein [Geopsychrobacter sp.]